MNTEYIMNFLIKKLDATETSKKSRIIYKIFCPLYYTIELICFFYYWKKIKTEILTNEELVDFLDQNEFGMKFHKFYKMDIVEPDSFINQFNTEEMEIKIKAEFTEELVNKISDNIAFDVENYINLNVNVSLLKEQKLKAYSVEIRYYRYYLVIQNIKMLIIWLLLALGISFLLIFDIVKWI